MSLLWFVAFYRYTEKALQWWSYRQSKHLFYEAENIRNDLLQESCAMRRMLESLLINEEGISPKFSQDYLEKIEKIYHSLSELSDRLAPINCEYSLPLGIQSLAALWCQKHPYLKINLEIPTDWRQESPELNLVILQILNELLQINLTHDLTKISISINLSLGNHLANLIVGISYPDKATLDSHAKCPNLAYLSKTFKVLTSGNCSRCRKNLTDIWYFQWSEV
ncbi:hypothetical protein [Floridanema evergladense]|uniref:Uncharacterized protein n=1 Tax=Floridaenema evergladense BLCC-F167 TaxID=3153639 RepID=A0ABV4WW83_9CYAN